MSLRDVFEHDNLKLCLDMNYPNVYWNKNPAGEWIPGIISISNIFASKDDIAADIDVFCRLVEYLSDPMLGRIEFKGIKSLVEDIAKIRDVKSAEIERNTKLCLIEFEGVLKIIFRLCMPDGESLVKKIDGDKLMLFRMINELGRDERYRFYREEAKVLFDSLIPQRNGSGHGVDELRIQDIDMMAKQLLVCLLHVVDCLREPLTAALDRIDSDRLQKSMNSSEVVEISEAELLAKYVSKKHDEFENYLKTNLMVASPDEIMPVKVENFSTRQSFEALDLINLEERVSIVLGAPGAGKTTMLKAMLMRVAEAYLDSPDEDSHIPVLIMFSEVTHGDTFFDMVCRAMGGIPETIVRKVYDEGRLTVTLDGLNEFTVEQGYVQTFLRGMFADINSDANRYIITGRVHEYRSIESLVSMSIKAPCYELQGVTPDMLVDYINNLKLGAKDTADLLSLLRRRDMICLLSSPLNFSMVMTVARDGGKFMAENRGRLLQEFVETRLKRDKADDIWIEQRRMALGRLAKLVRAEGASGIDRLSFMSRLLNMEPNLYRNIDEVEKNVMEPLMRTGLLVINEEGLLDFKIDTYREYFVAKSLADRFGKGETALPYALDDASNFETLRMMIEVLDKDKKRRMLVESLYDKGTPGRPVLDFESSPMLECLSPSLIPVAQLVSTLPMESSERGSLSAKALVEGWVLNHLRLLRAQRSMIDVSDKKAVGQYSSLVSEVIRAGAILSTRAIYLRIFDPFWLTPLSDDRQQKHISDIAVTLVKNCSDSSELYSMLTDVLMNMGMMSEVHKLAEECRRLFFKLMKPTEIGLLHQSIARSLGSNETKRDYATLVKDYFMTGVLTAESSVVKSLDTERVVKCGVYMSSADFNRILQRHGRSDVIDALFGENMMRYYKFSPVTLLNIFKYLIAHGAVDTVSRVMASGQIEKVMGLDRTRTVCNLMPLESVPERLIPLLYDAALMKTAADGAHMYEPWKPLGMTDRELAVKFRHSCGMFSSRGLHKESVSTFDYNVIGFDREGNLNVLTIPVLEPEAMVGCPVNLINGPKKYRAVIASCSRFESDICDLTMRMTPGGKIPLNGGAMKWHNVGAKVRNVLRYGYAEIQPDGLVRLRITDPTAINVLRTPKWRDLITSRSTTFAIDGVGLSIVSVRLVVEHGDYSQITFAPGEQTEKVLECAKFTTYNADETLRQFKVGCNFSASNELSDKYRVLMLDPVGNGRMVLAADPGMIGYVEEGLWLTKREAGYETIGNRKGKRKVKREARVCYHPRVTEPSRLVPGLAVYGLVRFNGRIPLSGTAIIGESGSPVEYYAVERVGQSEKIFYSLAFVGGDGAVELSQYDEIKLMPADGSKAVEYIVQEISVCESYGEMTLVFTDFVNADEADVAMWLDGGPAGVVFPSLIENRRAAEPSRYYTDIVPYTVSKFGNAVVIPQPLDTIKFSEYKLVLENTRLECTIPREKGAIAIGEGSITLRVVRCDDNSVQPPIMKFGDRIRFVPKDGGTPEINYSRLLPLVDMSKPDACHSSVAEIISHELVGSDIGIHTIKFFKALGMSHLLVATKRYDECFKKYKVDEPLISIAVVTAEPTDMVQYAGANFIGTAPYSGVDALHPGDMVVVESRVDPTHHLHQQYTGRLVRVNRTMPPCAAFGFFVGKVVDGGKRGVVTVNLLGKVYKVRNLGRRTLTPGQSVRVIINKTKKGINYYLCNDGE